MNVKMKKYWLQITLPYMNGTATYRRWYEESTESSSGWQLMGKSKSVYSSKKINRMALPILNGKKVQAKICKARHAHHMYGLHIDMLSK
jgi:hypothetical protein